MKRKASAKWQGSGMEGSGNVSTQSKAIDNLRYSFKTRFEEAITGTNPEELVAAAHAGCYSMALTFALNKAGFTSNSVETNATLTMEKQDIGWTTTNIHLETTVDAEGLNNDDLQRMAEDAKKGCPISRLLNTNITLDAKLKA